MKVSLINYTPDAINTLIFTKSTRLKMSVDGMQAVRDMPMEDKLKELEYMANTIKSSWEFIDFTFMIEGVSRAFTHQFVRTRTGSYAQQTMRILDVSGFDYITGPSILKDPSLQRKYDEAMEAIDDAYNELINMGASIEDARGILPTNICTNIVAKFNLRSLSDMMASRASSRTQGEYREVVEQMYECIINAYPWLEIFLHNDKYQACEKLQSIIDSDYEGTSKHIPYTKLVDKVRNSK